ncbi:Acyl-coenzyme A:6-aminopenicillanic acid acyl-transferase [Roseovarius albus]|uniref:Acyl-coenzyme A:6-aminopenicillanic acid acyl-transferase n=1 Tax=Roseovarius albus TaxID=1247867 RepID=A0A1X6Z9A8_9RHOB|nr:C45 family peptidase [Roseovarius albus]SLN44497.1 Acyl-coenzyme A:6-aminopenicillanic acid acyl-transferase [Roseovarius albus]
MTTLQDIEKDGQNAQFAMHRQLTLLSEDFPAGAWGEIHHRFWPAWKKWFERKGGSNASAEDGQRAIRRHMPEIERLIDRLADVDPNDAALRSFLTFWCPPRYLTNCSQAVSNDHQGPFLIRNYDLDPALNELTLLRTNWRGKRVIGMVDGLSGLSDGINENGLAISLSFGGRLKVGIGFGIPLIIRYILEICTDVQDAIEVLRRIPCHMSYNVTLTDRAGDTITVFLAPDRPPMIKHQNWATNHQIGVELMGHGRFSATMERAEILQATLSAPTPPTAEQLKHRFLSAPVFATNYDQGFGTVFTSLYRPASSSLELIFSNGSAGHWSVNDWPTNRIPLRFDAQGSHLL